jgi:hypothetical protein
MKSLNQKKPGNLPALRCARPLVAAADSLVGRNAKRPPTFLWEAVILEFGVAS